MATITLKNVPAGLHARLRDRAAAHRRSLNAEAVTLLEAALDDGVAERDAALERIRSRRATMGDTSAMPPADVLIRQDRDAE